jgi:type I restriction enzyme S subunit
VKKLGNLCDEFKSGKNIKANEISENGEYPVYGGNGLRGFSEIYNYIGVYVLIGRQGALCGNVRIIKGKCYITEHAIAVRGSRNNSTKFLLYLLDKMNLGQYSDQSAQPGLAVNKLIKLQVVTPQHSEQEKIASFLSLIDERIATQNKIIEQYKSLIKGLTDSIIKTKKTNFKLKDCVVCHSSSLTESEFEEDSGKYPVYGAAGIIAYSSGYNIEGDSILVIKDGASVGRVQYAAGKYSVIGTLNYLTAKKNFSLKYIYYYLRCFNFDKFKVGSGIPHIYFKDYGNEPIYCPSIKEQNKIAQTISSIERKLNLEQIALKTYTTQKIYLLQNLFI